MTEDFIFTDIDKNLLLLVEECSEVIQAVCKIKRFGFDSVHHSTGTVNREELVNEIGDVVAIITILKENGVFTGSEVNAAAARKMEKLKKWYNHQ